MELGKCWFHLRVLLDVGEVSRKGCRAVGSREEVSAGAQRRRENSIEDVRQSSHSGIQILVQRLGSVSS